jgi:hypothetical protein
LKRGAMRDDDAWRSRKASLIWAMLTAWTIRTSSRASLNPTPGVKSRNVLVMSALM